MHVSVLSKKNTGTGAWLNWWNFDAGNDNLIIYVSLLIIIYLQDLGTYSLAYREANDDETITSDSFDNDSEVSPLHSFN